jgi:hypothetical protein
VIPEKEMARLMATCRWFDARETRCGAGVDVRGECKRFGIPEPCLTGKGAWPCDKYQPTPADVVEAEWGALFEMSARAIERIAAGLCPHCGAKVERRVQVGKCVYAEPCRHRLGSGKA